MNTGASFAPLRQIYHAMILAAWYKKNLRRSVLGEAYADHGVVDGILSPDQAAKERTYQAYLESFKKGAYNFIREETDAATGETVPHRYFSGGLEGVKAVTEETRLGALSLPEVAQLPIAGDRLMTFILDAGPALENFPGIPGKDIGPGTAPKRGHSYQEVSEFAHDFANKSLVVAAYAQVLEAGSDLGAVDMLQVIVDDILKSIQECNKLRLQAPWSASLSEDLVERYASIQERLKEALAAVNALRLKRQDLTLGRLYFGILSSIQMLSRFLDPQAKQLVRSRVSLKDYLSLKLHPDSLWPGLTTNVIVDGDAGDVSLDVVLFDRVLDNLITNASEAKKGPVQITVRIERQGEFVRIAFEDNGPGFSADLLSRNWFLVQGHSTKEGRAGRAERGAGLVSSAKIVKLHGGTITPENIITDGKVTGARFVILLPVDPSQKPDVPMSSPAPKNLQAEIDRWIGLIYRSAENAPGGEPLEYPVYRSRKCFEVVLPLLPRIKQVFPDTRRSFMRRRWRRIRCCRCIPEKRSVSIFS